MERIIQYTVPKEESNRSVQDFLRQRGYSKKVLAALKCEPSGIFRNGCSVFTNEKVKENDKISIHLLEEESSETILPEYGILDIVYEDDDILVINKPAGMPIHPSVNHHTGTLANFVAGYYKKQGISYVFRCLNRLDRDTSGLVLLAKHMLSGAILSREVKKRALHRTYLAVVCGCILKDGKITSPIGRKPGSIIERMVDEEHGQEAITNYHVLAHGNGHTLVSIQLETGRTHQIRIHMKSIGHPLPGDFLYHPDYRNIKRQALHSYQLSFCHPITGEWMEFQAKLPQDMKAILKE